MGTTNAWSSDDGAFGFFVRSATIRIAEAHGTDWAGGRADPKARDVHHLASVRGGAERADDVCGGQQGRRVLVHHL